jgi:hypothetical protein
MQHSDSNEEFHPGGFEVRRMSDFGKVKSCINGCGALIYFDASSTIGHPSPDKWIPLEYIDNVKTNQAHNCPKRSNGRINPTGQQQQPQKDFGKAKENSNREIDIVAAVEAEPLILTVLKSIAERLDKIAMILEQDQREREELK